MAAFWQRVQLGGSCHTAVYHTYAEANSTNIMMNWTVFDMNKYQKEVSYKSRFVTSVTV